MLVVALDVGVDVEALEMCAEVPTGWGLDGCVGDRALQANQDLFGCLCLYFLDIRSLIPTMLKETKCSLQGEFWSFDMEGAHIIDNIMRLNYLDEENRTDLAHMIIITLVVLLLLDQLYSIFPSLDNRRDV